MLLPTLLNLTKIGEQDVRDWCDSRLRESVEREFKASYDPRTVAKEWCKDVSALANTVGGVIAIGVHEDGGAAQRIGAIADGEKLVEQLVNLSEAHIRPRVRIRFARLQLRDGGEVVLVGVARSRFAPHMVVAENDKKIYKRTELGASAMDIDELRDAFLLSASAESIALEMHRAHVHAVRKPDFENSLALILDAYCVPGTEEVFDPGVAAIRQRVSRELQPVFGTTTERISFDGLVRGHVAADVRRPVVRVLRNGSITGHCFPEWRQGDDVHRSFVPYLELARDVLQNVELYLGVHEMLDAPHPSFLCFTISNAVGYRFPSGRHVWDSKPIDNPRLEFSVAVLEREDVKKEAHETVCAWMNRLAQASGIAEFPVRLDE